MREQPHNKFIFDAAGHLNENKEDLKNKLEDLSSNLDEEGQNQLKEEKDDILYCQKVSSMITFCEEYLKVTRQSAIGKYL